MLRIRTTTSLLAGLIALLAAGLLAPESRAQTNSDGSLYSRFGLGLLTDYSSTQIEAMGGNGVGLRSLNYVNFQNPASWSDQLLTRAVLGVQVESVASSDATDATSRLTSGDLRAVGFSFPILARRLGIAAAFLPYSRVGYRVREVGYVRPDPSIVADSIAYNVNFEGDGGLQQIVAGAGYRVNRYLSVGGDVRVLFGIIETGRRTAFPNTDGFTEADVVLSTRMLGVTGTLGAIGSLTGVLREEDHLSLGATFTLPTRLDARRVRTVGEGTEQDTLGARIDGQADLPMAVAAGGSYRPDDRWTLTLGGQYQPWSEFTSDLPFPGYAPGATNQFFDRIRLSGGVEFLPAGSDLLEPYLRRVAYRLGLVYDQAYVNPQPAASLNTMAVTGGLSLPTLVPGTRLDVNMEVGTRGTTDLGLVHDLYYRFSATVNIGERWFLKQKLR